MMSDPRTQVGSWVQWLTDIREQRELRRGAAEMRAAGMHRATTANHGAGRGWLGSAHPSDSDPPTSAALLLAPRNKYENVAMPASSFSHV
jgi:hypothetical protein